MPNPEYRPARRLAPPSVPGSRPSRGFFDDYPEFYETSETTPHPDRLNLRYEAIFDENREVFQGARVLDIASHDGRWSFAALKTGARHVTGIEAKEGLVESARATCAGHGVDPATYEFVAGDVYEVLNDRTFEVDVVMCLGFLYHTLRYNELLSHVRRMNPRHVIVDTDVLRGGRRALVRLKTEPDNLERSAVADRYSYGGTVLSGRPNVRAVHAMFRAYAFGTPHVSDWGSLLRDNPGATFVADYAEKRRVTVRYADTRHITEPSSHA